MLVGARPVAKRVHQSASSARAASRRHARMGPTWWGCGSNCLDVPSAHGSAPYAASMLSGIRTEHAQPRTHTFAAYGHSTLASGGTFVRVHARGTVLYAMIWGDGAST